MRTFNLLKYLSQRHFVTVITQRSSDVTDAEVEALRSCVRELAIFPLSDSPAGGVSGKITRFGTFLLRGTPPNVLHSYSPAIQNWVDESVAAGKFDAITCERSRE